MITENLVSVVLATNRGGPYLRDALISVSVQHWQQYEVIIVDDGSTIGATLDELVEDFSFCRVIHIPASGVAIARNIGIAASRGEFIVFLDDDDLWLPTRLNRQVNQLREWPEAVGCHSQYDVIDSDGHVFSGGHSPSQEGWTTLLPLLENQTWVLIGTLLVRRSALDMIGGFHSAIAISEDMDLVWRLARVGPLRYVPDVLVHSRQHPSSVTRDITRVALNSVRVHQVHVWLAQDQADSEITKAARRGLRASKEYWSSRIIGTSITTLPKRPWMALTWSARGFHSFPLAFTKIAVKTLVGTIRRDQRIRGS